MWDIYARRASILFRQLFRLRLKGEDLQGGKCMMHNGEERGVRHIIAFEVLTYSLLISGKTAFSQECDENEQSWMFNG